MKDEIRRLNEVFKDVKFQFGLRQQGHIPTVQRMLGEGKSWDEIGKEIGWKAETAKEFYELEEPAMNEQHDTPPKKFSKSFATEDSREHWAHVAEAVKRFESWPKWKQDAALGYARNSDETPAAPKSGTPPTKVKMGFQVIVECHTDDAIAAITSPDALRWQLGHMLDSWGINEEIDYTLKVTRTYEQI